MIKQLSTFLDMFLWNSKCNLEMDFEAILSSIQFSAAPPGKTLIKGIKRLNPGTNLIVDSKNGIKSYTYKKLQPEKWFDAATNRIGGLKTLESKGIKQMHKDIQGLLLSPDTGRVRISTLVGN